MAKRFTDTDIWEQDWFIALPNKYKFLWFYIKDKCDDCGVWRPNKEMLQRILSEPINLNEFLVYINTDEKNRILVLENGRWFLKDYFFFQYGDKFNPHSPVHKGALKRLITHGIHIKELNKVDCKKLNSADNEQLRSIAYDKDTNSLLISFGYPINRTKDKDKNKDIVDNAEVEYILTQIREIDDVEIGEGQENLYAMIVLKMLETYRKHNPEYPFDKDEDYKAALQIAYRIAQMKDWKRDSVLNGHMDDCIKSWEKIVLFINSNKWFSSRTLRDLSMPNEWKRLVLEMKNATPAPAQTVKKMVD